MNSNDESTELTGQSQHDANRTPPTPLFDILPAGAVSTAAIAVRRTMRPLQIVIVVYGVLYLVFVLLATIPSTRGNIISSEQPDFVSLSVSLIQLQFTLFILGCAASWRSKLLSGLLFVLWWAFLAWGSSFSRRYGGVGGMEGVLGFPILIFGIIYIFSWLVYRTRWLHNR